MPQRPARCPQNPPILLYRTPRTPQSYPTDPQNPLEPPISPHRPLRRPPNFPFPDSKMAAPSPASAGGGACRSHVIEEKAPIWRRAGCGVQPRDQRLQNGRAHGAGGEAGPSGVMAAVGGASLKGAAPYRERGVGSVTSPGRGGGGSVGATLSGVHERDPSGWRRCGRGWVRNAPSRVPPVFPRCAPGVPGGLGGVGGGLTGGRLICEGGGETPRGSRGSLRG